MMMLLVVTVVLLTASTVISGLHEDTFKVISNNIRFKDWGTMEEIILNGQPQGIGGSRYPGGSGLPQGCTKVDTKRIRHSDDVDALDVCKERCQHSTTCALALYTPPTTYFADCKLYKCTGKPIFAVNSQLEIVNQYVYSKEEYESGSTDSEHFVFEGHGLTKVLVKRAGNTCGGCHINRGVGGPGTTLRRFYAPMTKQNLIVEVQSKKFDSDLKNEIAETDECWKLCINFPSCLSATVLKNEDSPAARCLVYSNTDSTGHTKCKTKNYPCKPGHCRSNSDDTDNEYSEYRLNGDYMADNCTSYKKE